MQHALCSVIIFLIFCRGAEHCCAACKPVPCSAGNLLTLFIYFFPAVTVIPTHDPCPPFCWPPCYRLVDAVYSTTAILACGAASGEERPARLRGEGEHVRKLPAFSVGKLGEDYDVAERGSTAGAQEQVTNLKNPRVLVSSWCVLSKGLH